MNQPANRNGFRKLFIPLLKLAIIACSFNTAHAQEVIFRQVADTKTDTHAEVTALFSAPSVGGFHPVRVFISNRQLIPHTIYLNVKSSTNYNSSISTSSDYSFTVKPKESASYDILIPLTPQNGQSNYEDLNISLSGSMGKNHHNNSARFANTQPCVLLSDSLYTPNASALDSEVASRSSGHSYSGASGQFASRFTPSQLPDDWRAFSGFDSILMTADDWMSVPPGPRNAITAWLRLGGQLVIYSPNSATPNALGLPADSSYGEVLIKPITGDRLDPKPTVDLVNRRTIKTRNSAIKSDFNASWPLQNELEGKNFNSVLFILILIAFGIIVGPVNLFVFAKSGRRHRLFITTPIISITTSVLLIVLIIFQDGFGGAGKRLVLMEVRPDENQNAAFIHQEQFSRTGVMTSPSFTINDSALFVPVPIRASRWSRFTEDYETSGNYDLQPTGGKLYATGSWFQSRSEQGQLVSAVVPTRGRIEFAKDSNKIVSNFEFPIKTLVFRDKDQYFRADNLTKGKPVELQSIDSTIAFKLIQDINKKFTSRNQGFFKRVNERDGCFVAITEEAPGIDTNPSIDWETTTVITGPIVR